MTPDDPPRRRRVIEARVPQDAHFTGHTAFGSGVEFDAIRRMLERWGPNARGVGDDAAVISPIGDRSLVVSTDTSVENVHFRREWLTPQEIGYRATAAALSDIAAMAARPLGILVALTLPESWHGDLDALTDGIGEAAMQESAPILGGDTTAGERLSLTVTVLGTARDVLVRSGARDGDLVYVTGRLGGSLSALRDFQAGRIPDIENRRKFAHPCPRIAESEWLAAHGATSAIDISDGLAAEASHLAAASRVSITIRVEDIPLVQGVSALDAACSGEEYELVVTAHSQIDTSLFKQRFELDLTEIGMVSGGSGGAILTLDGEPVALPAGYLHFTK